MVAMSTWRFKRGVHPSLLSRNSSVRVHLHPCGIDSSLGPPQLCKENATRTRTGSLCASAIHTYMPRMFPLPKTFALSMRGIVYLSGGCTLQERSAIYYVRMAEKENRCGTCVLDALFSALPLPRSSIPTRCAICRSPHGAFLWRLSGRQKSDVGCPCLPRFLCCCRVTKVYAAPRSRRMLLMLCDFSFHRPKRAPALFG